MNNNQAALIAAATANSNAGHYTPPMDIINYSMKFKKWLDEQDKLNIENLVSPVIVDDKIKSEHLS